MSILLQLPDELRIALQRELQPGESVRWQGRPHPGHGSRKVFALWFFAIPWTAFSLFFFGTAFASLVAATGVTSAFDGPKGMPLGMAIVFTLFSTPFVLIGLAMMSAPFYEQRRLARTLYAVTDMRVLSLTLGRITKVESIIPAQIGPLSKTLRADGSGTLAIQTGSHRDSDGDRHTDTFSITETPGIAQAEQAVLELRDRKP